MIDKKLTRRIERMIALDKENQKMFAEVDRMWEMRWNLPDELAGLDWIRKAVSSDPHDAVRAATRVLGSVTPKLKIAPLAPNVETREAMDRLERALTWHFENANRRRGNPLYDIVRNAVLYDRVAAQVVYLPHQASAAGTFTERQRKEAAKRYGPYAIIVRDTKNVFVDYSDWMAERVCHRYVLGAHEVINFWGDRAKSIQKDIDKSNDDGASLWYTVYDYTDFEKRTVFAVKQENETASFSPPDATSGQMIMDEEHGLSFLPWVVRSGGKDLIPMLYSVSQADQWEQQNIFETIMSSEVIAYAAAPRGVKTSATPEMIDVEYSDPNRDIELYPGETYERLRPPEIDSNMAEMSDRIQSRISKSTIPNVIQTGDFPSGTAYATLNLATESGIKALTPYKRLAEEALSDIFAQMLYWIDFTKDTVESYPPNLEIRGNSDYVEITPNDFDVDYLYLSVEITPDVPTDRMQRINGAVMANQNLNYSNRRALEDIGVTEPGAEIDQWYEEQTRMRDWDLEQQVKLQQVMQELEFKQQQRLMGLEQQMMEQQQQQMQGAQQAGISGSSPGGGAPVGSLPDMMRNPQIQQQYARNTGRGFETTQGSAGFNPALQGEPPAIVNPGGTRETQKGTNLGE